MIDSKKIVYLPSWAKALILSVLAICLTASIFISISYVGIPEHSDWILLALSITQFAATALIASILLIFGERAANLEVLKRKTAEFLQHQLPKTLASIEDTQGQTTTVTTSSINNIFGCNYSLTTDNIKAKLWIGLNVDRLIIAYFIPKTLDTERIRSIFRYTFGGADSVGYKINYEEAFIQDTQEEILSIWCTWPNSHDSTTPAIEVLSNPEKKLFLIQDIAMMTQSFLRTAQRNAVPLQTQCDPGPL